MKNKFTLVLLYIVSMILLVLFNNICNEYGITTGHRLLLLMSIVFSYELGKPIYIAVSDYFKGKNTNKEVPANGKNVSAKEK